MRNNMTMAALLLAVFLRTERRTFQALKRPATQSAHIMMSAY